MGATRLPNGDVYDPKPEGYTRPDTITSATDPPPPNPVDAAIQAHKDKPSIECPWCSVTSDSTDGFIEHMKSFHPRQLGLSAEEARAEELAAMRRAGS